MQEMWAPAVQAGARPALGSHDWRGLRGGEINQPQRLGEKGGGGGRGSRVRASAGQSAGAGPSRVTSLPSPPALLPLAPRLPAVSQVGGRYRTGLASHAREGGCRPCSSLSWVPPSPPSLGQLLTCALHPQPRVHLARVPAASPCAASSVMLRLGQQSPALPISSPIPPTGARDT